MDHMDHMDESKVNGVFSHLHFGDMDRVKVLLLFRYSSYLIVTFPDFLEASKTSLVILVLGIANSHKLLLAQIAISISNSQKFI